MRQINRKINLSDYKSYVKSHVMSYKDNILVDINDSRYQALYNQKTTHGMLPVSVSVDIGTKTLRWSWHTLHDLYMFCSNIKEEEAITNPNGAYDEYINYFQEDLSYWENNFADIQNDIIYYVENGVNDNCNLLHFEVTDELLPQNGCKELDIDKQTCFELPLYLNHTIDNMGLMNEIPDEWVEKTPYPDGMVVTYDGRDWRLKEDSGIKVSDNDKKEISQSGYTWNKIFKESVFGNLSFNKDIGALGAYVEKEEKKPWERNISYEMFEREVTGYTKNNLTEVLNVLDGTDFASCLGTLSNGKGYITNNTDLSYSYKNYRFVPNPDKDNMSDKYPLETAKKFFIDNNIVYIIGTYYIVDNTSVESNCSYFFNDKKSFSVQNDNFYVVEFEYSGNRNPYINIGSRKLYGYKDNNGDYVFESDNVKYVSHEVEGVFYNGELKIIDSDATAILFGDYKKFNLLSIDNNDYYVNIDSIYYTVKNGVLGKYTLVGDGIEYNHQNTDEFGANLTTNNNIDNNSYGYFIKGNDLYILQPYNIYNLQYISGTTASQLSLFKIADCTYDELGGSVEGVLLYAQKNKDLYKGVVCPLPNDSLSLLYVEKTASNVEQVATDNGKERYFGNFLDTIDFYLADADGNKIDSVINGEDILEKLKKDEETTGEFLKTLYSTYTVIPNYDETAKKLIGYKITSLEDAKKSYEGLQIANELNLYDVLNKIGGALKCRFKYYLGTFLDYDKNEKEFKLADGCFKGVEYEDIYTVVRKTYTYGRSASDYYTIYYYELVGEKIEYTDDNSIDGDVKSNFKMEVPLYKIINNHYFAEFNGGSGKTFYDVGVYNTDHYGNEIDKINEYNGFNTLPLTRKDYNIGIALQEKVLGDIYIDRGISSAFEKHLKLQEVDTLEDLENYSNGGFFTITSN